MELRLIFNILFILKLGALSIMMIYSNYMVAVIILCSFVGSLWLFLRLLQGYKDNFPRWMMTPIEQQLNVNHSIKKIEGSFKNGFLRRKLILESLIPSDYSSTIDNDIIISENDIDDKKQFLNKIRTSHISNKRVLFGFFHPYCNAFGGGEKVLWKAIETTLQKDLKNIVIVYTGDYNVSGQQILTNVKNRFDYTFNEERIVFIHLKYRRLVDDKTWPRFTLIGQAFGSIILCLEAFFKCPPDIWCDTMGYPFGYPFVSILGNLPIVTYTHFPVISTDMLEKLRSMPGGMNLNTKLKYLYWRLFMVLYQFAGMFVTVVITNSTWTNNHIKKIWPCQNSKIIYPPCSTEKLVIKDNSWNRKNQAVVIAQFRPEKRHILIIESYSECLQKVNESDKSLHIPKLILIGSTRSHNDRDYVAKLSTWAYDTLKIPRDQLEFKTDCPYNDVKKYLHESSYGINAMWNEHFGISVVEYVAAGLIPLVHASAGPFLDIVVPWDIENKKQALTNGINTRTGFFFKSDIDPDYKKDDNILYPSLQQLFLSIIELSDEEKYEISERGKACVTEKFSDAKFDKEWDNLVLCPLGGMF